MQRMFAFSFAALVFALFAGILPTIFIHHAGAQEQLVVTGPTFDIQLHKPDFKQRENTYCSDYFVRERATKYSSNEYVLFYYLDENKTLAHDEVQLEHLVVAISKDETLTGPKAHYMNAERGQINWDLIMTQEMYDKLYGACLTGVKVK